MADGSQGGQNRVRIAHTGEEFGFGYQAVEALSNRAKNFGLSDGGISAIGKKISPQEIEERKAAWIKTFERETRLPLRTKEQTLMAVKTKTADIGVIPFYHPNYGYDWESLRALASQLTLFGVEQVEATDSFCLAVYEPQVLDLVQSAHPGSGLSTLLKHSRRHWQFGDGGMPLQIRGGLNPEIANTGELYRAGLTIDHSQQMMLRDRIDTVFAGPEALRRCKSKLDGLRAAGVDIVETLESVEPHREMARLARAGLNPNRQTNTFFNPKTGETQFVSTAGSEPQVQKLYGVLVPFQVAMMSQDFTIVDPYVEDADPVKTRFLAVKYLPDDTLFEDAYRTTDAKTRYWMVRMRAIAHDGLHAARKAGAEFSVDPVGAVLALAGLLFAAVGFAGLSGWRGVPLIPGSPELVALSDAAALALGVGLTLIGFGRFLKTEGGGAHDMNGIRVLLAVQRSGTAAAIADVENFLRNFGVRHQVVRIDEDSERSSPAAAVLDIEFMCDDLYWNLSRRLRGSVLNGALKKAFARWKSRGVLVLAAMPFAQPQMPAHKRRHWLWDAPIEWFKDAAETWFIRLRILFYLLPVAAAAYGVWVLMGGGK